MRRGFTTIGFVAAISVLGLGCRGGTRPGPAHAEAVSISAIPADFRIRQSRSPCFGTCPVYNLEVQADGQVVYEGFSYVSSFGQERWTIPPEAVARLLAEVREGRFFDLGIVNDVVVWDAPQLWIEVTLDGRTRSWVDEGVYLHEPDTSQGMARHTLRVLGDEIDRVTDAGLRIGPPR
jgi:hypothetical protein